MGIQMKAPAKAEGDIELIAHSAKDLLTGLRQNERYVYEALRQAKTPQKAYDLLEELRDSGLRSPMTIYRALDSLIARGHVRKIESINAFIAIQPGTAQQAHAFLICKKCHKTKEIMLNEERASTLFSPLQVSVDDVRIEALVECHEVCFE